MVFIPTSLESGRRHAAPISVPQGCSKTQAILETLGRSIVTGRYPIEGVSVTEKELCRHFGVARGSLREAIRGLRGKGLVDLAPRLGLWVQPERCWNLLDSDILRWLLERRPSCELLTELIQIRLAIQPRAAALAAIAICQTENEALVTAANQLLGEAHDNDPMGQIMTFHSGTLRATQNRFFEQMTDLVSTTIRMTDRYLKGALCFEAAGSRILTTIARDILDANAESAERNMRRLLDHELRLVMSEAVSRKSRTR